MATEKFIVQMNQSEGGSYYEELGVFETFDEAKKFAEDYKVKSELTPLQAIIDMCNASPERIYDFMISDFMKESVNLEIANIEDDKWIYLETYFLMPDDLKESKVLHNFFRSLNIDPHDINFVV